MKYIIGYTPFAYDILGVVIPKKEVVRTEAGAVPVTEAQLKELADNSTFISLVEQKSIKVLDTKPSWAISSAEKMQEKDDELKQRDERIAELEAQLAKGTKPIGEGQK